MERNLPALDSLKDYSIYRTQREHPKLPTQISFDYTLQASDNYEQLKHFIFERSHLQAMYSRRYKQ